MRRWKAWIVGALALTGLAAAPEMAQARSTPVPDLLPITGTTTPASSGTVAPTCQYGYYHPGWRRHHGWRRHYGWRRPYYGYRRYGYRRPYYGYRRHWRHRYYRPIGFYHRPWGYHHAYYGYHRPWRHNYGYRHYGW